jgi:hypothetical protein
MVRDLISANAGSGEESQAGRIEILHFAQNAPFRMTELR